MSLNNLSVRLADLGRREEALAAIEEAVTLRRQLAAARPDAFPPDLAASLNNLSSRLSGTRRGGRMRWPRSRRQRAFAANSPPPGRTRSALISPGR